MAASFGLPASAHAHTRETAIADTSPPIISSPAASSVTATGATITWTTDEPSDSQVEYGPTLAFGSSSVLNSSLVTTHAVTLSGLTGATVYRFRVRSRDAAGNLAVAAELGPPPYSVAWDTTTVADGTHVLTVVARDAAGNASVSAPVSVIVANNGDTVAPVISNLRVPRIGVRKATIAWSTNEPSSTEIQYGTSAAYGRAFSNLTPVTAHAGTLSGLTSGTLYHYKASSRDAAGNVATSSDRTFTTSRVVLNRSQLFFGAKPMAVESASTPGATALRITSAQSVTVNMTGGIDDWVVTADQPWIQVSPSSGTGAGTFTVSIASGTPASGTGTIAITAVGETEPELTLPITYTAFSSTGPPTGLIDTPVVNAGPIVGALPVTGWAVHDIEITGVQIWRDAVAGEPPGSRMFVGYATFVDGARPDVESSFAMPFNYQGGWGYMLLTNMLPNQGNGTFTLHAIAIGADGSSTQLGSRTITCDNAHANRPFGTLDTPAAGATVSGPSYMSFGWALTSNPAVIPADGSTLQVFVDGIPIGRPSYNYFRNDLATLFPGLANSGGAVGYFPIDTTRLANAVHTIAWTVSDNMGRVEGIGSRFFTVMNPTGPQTAGSVAEPPPAQARGDLGRAADALMAAPMSTVFVRHGYDHPSVPVPADATGTVQVSTHELERIELALGNDPAAAYAGYLVIDGELRDLPAGSSFDASRGVLTWQPAAGFIGGYDLVFVKTTPTSHTPVKVRVTIEPFRANDPHRGRER